MPLRRRTELRGPAPLEGVDLLLADLDGVVYRGADPIPHAVEALNAAHERMRVGYITNNASRTDQTVAEHLRSLGLRAEASDVVTSPQAAVVLLAGLVDPGSTILVVGGDGLVREVERAGFRVTRSADDAPAAVVQGFAPEVGWEQLAEASFALRVPGGIEAGRAQEGRAQDGSAGIPWVATNTDWTIPVARGTAPGNGTLVSAVHTATGRFPVVAGKPERAIFDAAVERFRAARPLFVGDRLDTDILGANRAGIPAALVLTGIDGPKQVLAADAGSRPAFILDDLRALEAPYPRSVETVERRSGDRIVAVNDAVVRASGAAVRRETGDGIDLLRAAAAAIWGGDRPIHVLDVDPRLYSGS